MLATLFLAAAIACSLHGRVIADGSPLPGAEVALLKTPFTTITDSRGLYAFRGLPPGSLEIEFKLEGFGAERKPVELRTGENILPDLEMRFTAQEQIVIACGGPCYKEDPKTKWDQPSCADYDFDSALGESLRQGDASARVLLRKRYDTTFTISERQNIAGMLLRNVSDDTTYWTELFQAAEDAVRYMDSDETTRAKFEAYCAERGLDPDGYTTAMYHALAIVSKDPRSRPLLIRALESSDPGMVGYAISGLGIQHDLKSLETIDQVLARLADDHSYAALCLLDFHCEEADRIAFKYLSEEARADYTAAADFFRATSREE